MVDIIEDLDEYLRLWHWRLIGRFLIPRSCSHHSLNMDIGIMCCMSETERETYRRNLEWRRTKTHAHSTAHA